MICGKCGTENRDGAKYCRKCGAPLVDSHKSEASRAVLLFVIALFVFGLGGYALYRYSKGLVEGNGEIGAEQHTASDSTEDKNADNDKQEGQEAANEAYAAKLKEYLSLYGNPDVRVAQNSVSTQGVCVAELIDFNGNDSDELLVVYYDRDAADPFDSNLNDSTAYVAEVWSYVDEDLKMVYKQPTQATNGGFALLNRIETENGSSWLESEDYTGSHYFKLWSISDDASSVAHQFEIRDEYSVDMSYWLDGVEQSGPEDWPSSFATSRVTYNLMDNESTNDESSTVSEQVVSHSAYDCIDLTKETVQKLGISTDGSASTDRQQSLGASDDALAAFRDVVSKDLNVCGQPGKQIVGGEAYAEGLCLALLLDLNGDNLEELIVVGHMDDLEDGNKSEGLYHDPRAYVGDTYQFRNGTAEWLFSFTPEYSESGVAFVSIIEGSTAAVPPYLFLLRDSSDPDEFTLYGMKGYEFRGFGSYDAYTHKTEQEFLDSKLGTYAISEYHLFESELGSAMTGVVGKNGVAKAYSVDECLSITRDTMAKLGL